MTTPQRISTMFCSLAFVALGLEAATVSGGHLIQLMPDGNPPAGVSSSQPGFGASLGFTNHFNGQFGSAFAGGNWAGAGSGIGASLSAENSMTILNAAPGFYFSLSEVFYQDQLTITGFQPGTQATFNFLLTGNATNSGLSYSDAVIDIFFLSGVGGIIDSEFINTPVGGSLDVTLGLAGEATQNLFIRLQARNCLGCFAFDDRYGHNVSGNADFGSTLVLQSVSVTDFAGQPVAGTRITGEDGAIYVEGASSAVPEPASAALLVGGLVALSFARRRSGKLSRLGEGSLS